MPQHHKHVVAAIMSVVCFNAEVVHKLLLQSHMSVVLVLKILDQAFSHAASALTQMEVVELQHLKLVAPVTMSMVNSNAELVNNKLPLLSHMSVELVLKILHQVPSHAVNALM